MSKLTDSILAAKTAYAGHGPVMDLTHGGQGGQTAAIGRLVNGTAYGEWISNQAYVRQNIIPVVLDYPRGLDSLPESQKLIDTYNAMMTLHPETIEGLSSGLSVDFDQHSVGPTEQQDEITRVTRAVSSVTNTYKEKAGKAITHFGDFLIRYLYSDPDVEKPLISNISGFQPEGAMYTPEYFSGTHLYIEPDILQRRVVDAWLVTNVMIKGTGDRTGKRDIHSARGTQDISWELTGITMNNEAVLALAETILAKMTVLGTNPEIDMTVPANDLSAPSLGFGGNGSNSVDYNSTPTVNPTATPVV